MNISQIRKKVNSVLAEYSLAKKQYKTEKTVLQETENNLSDILEAQKITQAIAQTIQQQAHDRISGVVSRCLETVFDDTYGFRIDFDRKRGRTEAKLLLLKEGNEIEDPLNEDSGGVVEIASFALRLACLLLSKPVLRRVLILDEPFKNVSLENMVRVKKLLEGLSADFKVQFIIVTHITSLQIGKVVKL